MDDRQSVIVHGPSSIVPPTYRLCRLQGAAAGEDGEPGEEGTLGFVEEVVAPIYRAAQRLLAGGEVPCAAGEELEPALQAGEHGLRGEEADAGDGELDSQGQAVEAVA